VVGERGAGRAFRREVRVVGGRAIRLWREGVVLERMRALQLALPVPEVVALSRAPALVVTRRVAGVPLSWEWAGSLPSTELAQVGDEIAGVLTRLHGIDPSRILGDLPVVEPTPQASTTRLRAGMPRLVDDDRAAAVLRWCAWVDDTLRAPARSVLVHGDLHGYNQVWDPASLHLELVVDFEESGIADPHYDLRYLPGNAPTLDLLFAVVDAYARISGHAVSVERVMAWHVLTALGDALWRTEAGVELPGGGTASSWVDDVAMRLETLDLG
jgi:aminoglycoside phosphotransferase (APT) family kinase protein